MKKRIVFLSLVSVVMMSQFVPLFGQDNRGNANSEVPQASIFWAKGQGPENGAKVGQAGTSPNLTWHGGPIMGSAQATAIFWGSSWGNANFRGDKMTGIDTFYSGFGLSSYANTNVEYRDNGGFVTNNLSYTGSLLDLSPAAVGNGNRTSPILAEVCRMITNPVANGYYPVYVDTPRGHAGFCAWHSAGSCGSTPVQFAFFFNLDGDPGCDPQDSSGLHSQGLAALANVSGHELSEALTDPRLNAWYDSGGAENADKCAWSFGTPLLTFSNNSQWKIQGNWSNSAYNGPRGYLNRSGQKGCIDGGNYN